MKRSIQIALLVSLVTVPAQTAASQVPPAPPIDLPACPVLTFMTELPCSQAAALWSIPEAALPQIAALLDIGTLSDLPEPVDITESANETADQVGGYPATVVGTVVGWAGEAFQCAYYGLDDPRCNLTYMASASSSTPKNAVARGSFPCHEQGSRGYMAGITNLYHPSPRIQEPGRKYRMLTQQLTAVPQNNAQRVRYVEMKAKATHSAAGEDLFQFSPGQVEPRGTPVEFHVGLGYRGFEFGADIVHYPDKAGGVPNPNLSGHEHGWGGTSSLARETLGATMWRVDKSTDVEWNLACAAGFSGIYT